MGSLALFTIFAGVLSSLIGAATQASTNAQNQQLAQSTLQSQQEYATQAAETANEKTVQNYWDLYSPQSRVKQIKDAGLSVGLMYGNGAGISGSATTAAQAATPTATVPTMQNPFGDNLSTVTQAIKAAAEGEKTKEETKKVAVEIEEISQNIKKIEAETGNTIISTLNTELQNQLLENEIKISNESLEDQVKTIKENLRLIENNADKAFEECRSAKIDADKRGDLLQAEIDYTNAQKEKCVKERLLVIAQTATEEARKKLTDEQTGLTEKQKQEMEAKLAAIEKYGYMVVNGTGWQDRIINALLEMVSDIADWVNKSPITKIAKKL